MTDFGGNAIIYGVVGATYSAFQLIGAPIWGRWSDRYGRKIILLISQVGTLAAWLVFLVALFLPVTRLVEGDSTFLGQFTLTLPLVVLFAARALDGFTGGNVAVAHAYLADVTDERERSKNFGRLGVAQHLGFTIGPALAGVLGATVFGATVPVAVALAISIAAVLVIVFQVEDPGPPALAREGNKTALRQVLAIKNIPYLLVVYFVIFLAYNIFYTAFPIYALQGLGWSILQMGVFFAFLSLVGVIVQGPVLARVSTIYSDATLCLAGNAVLGTSFVLLTSKSALVMYIAVALFSIGTGFMWPSFLSILSKQAGETHQGSVQGFAGSSGSLASIIGLILGGFLYVSIGPKTFLVSALVIFFTFLLSIRLIGFEQTRKQETTPTGV